MNQEALESFAREWLAAWTGNQPEALLEYYDENARYLDPGRPEGIVGKTSLRAYFTKLLAVNPEWIWSLVELMPTEAGFTLKWEARIPVGTTTISTRGLDIVELSGRHITRNEVYFDRTPLLAAMQEQRKSE